MAKTVTVIKDLNASLVRQDGKIMTKPKTSKFTQSKSTTATINTEETAMTTTNETNGNGQVLSTANIHKLASAIGVEYHPEATVEDLLFSDQPSNQLLADLAITLGTTDAHLSNILINDLLTGNGDKAKLLRLIADDIKNKQVEQQKKVIESRKQALLSEVSELNQQLAIITGIGAV